jgi:transcriptional regulator with GAF, ATPase, and Fis domain
MDATERELLWLRRVRDVSQRLAAERDLEALLPKILDAAIEITEAERGYLVLVRGKRPDGAWDLKIAQARGFDGVDVPAQDVALSRTVVERVLQREERGLVTTSEADRDVIEVTSVKDRRVLSIACVPMRLRGQTTGILYIDHRFSRQAFTAADLPILRTFADQAALASETATLLAEREPQADGLAQVEALRARQDALDAGHPAASPASDTFGRLVGAAPAMGALYEEIERAARCWDSALVLGEGGSGTSAVAAEIHARSGRAKEPFLTLNCATAPAQTVASELFGHRKGAYPWATSHRRGLVVLAGKGTLLLQNVESLPPPVQAQLLRVLREEQVLPPGADKPQKVSARVIATSHDDLRQRVADGSFRSDLYYQLDVLRVIVPPLRQRRDDVPALVAHFARELGKPKLKVSAKALEVLGAYAWPGNVTQLRNEVQRLIRLDAREVTTPMLSEEIQEGRGVTAADGDAAGKTLSEVERDMVAAALEASKGVKSRAARQLGIPRTTLYHLMERYGLA